MADFNILMLGARRAGKTSVLASMLSCFQRVTSNSRLRFIPMHGTLQRLTEKLEELTGLFYGPSNQCFPVDGEPTSEINVFEFKVELPKKKSYTLAFTDFPGELLDTDSEKVADLLSESQVVMIAVDTPHLMEENGAFNKAFNRMESIYQVISGANWQEEIPRLVLYVPIKCEKYYHRNELSLVNRKIKEEFQRQLGYFGSPNLSNSVTVAITPILTVGDLIFSEFGRDADNQVPTYGKKEGLNKFRPKFVFYRFWGTNPQFSPRYCEQPLLFTLWFTVVVSKRSKKGMKVLGDLRQLLTRSGLFKIWQDAVLRKELEVLRPLLKINQEGYELLQNPLNLELDDPN